MIARLLCASAIFLIAALPARSQTVDVSVLINDPGSAGCDVTPTGLPTIAGVNAQLTATVDRLAAQVINVDLSVCTGAAFGPPTSVGGGQPVGNDNGFNGADVVEMSVPRAMVTPSGNSLRIVAVADNGVGVDATSLGVLGAPVTAVPGPGVIGLTVLALLILALAWVALKRQRVLASLLLVGLSFAVLAMNFMVDGQVGDWASVPPVALDPPGDGTNGETAVDIVALFAGQEDQGGGLELFFRVDMADLIINNQLPVAQDDALATDEDNPVAGDVFADNGNGIDSDPDSDPFSVTMVAGTATVGAAVTLPSGAQVTVNADGTFSYDPLAAFNALSQGQITTDTFTYTIDDAIAGSDQATATVTITGVNDVGTAVDDPAYATGEDTPLNQAAPGVLGNDTDPDTNDTLTAVLDTGPTSALSFTLSPDGSFSYTPALNFNGTDSFTYHFNDGFADSNIATATINVGGVNDPPVGVDDSGDATDEDTPITTQNVLTNDTDVDLDPLSVASVDAVSAQGAAITDNGDGTFNYDPTASATLNALSVGQMVTDTFNYTVTDGFLNDTATVSVDVTGVNDPMTANDDGGAGFATDEDTSFTTGNVLSNDTDPDAGDTLSVMSVDAVSAQGASITDLGNGTFTYDPTGAAALQALAAGAMVTDTFSYTGSDGNGSTDTETVSIDVSGINDDPVIAFPTGGAVFNNLGPVNLDPAATLTDVDSPDFDTGDLTASVALSANTSMCDVNDSLIVENQGMGAGQIGFDGLNVSFESTVFGTVTTPYLCSDLGGGLFDIQPLLIAFDPNASIAAVTALLQALQYNTSSADDQDREASAMVTDGDGGTSNAALATITVNLNQAPVITSDGGGATAMVNAAENQTAVTTVTATDADIPAQTLTFSISGGADPALFSIGAASGVLTFNSAPDFENPTDAGADNVYDVQVTVTDDGTPNLSDSQDIAVTVTNVNEAPVINSDGGGATASVNAAENQTAVTDVMSTDPDGETEGAGLSYTLTGGADQGAFSIVAGSGVLTFMSAPDFDVPGDADMGNDYEVQVTVTDGGTLTDVQDLTVNVTDINEPPTITMIADQMPNEDTATGALGFTVDDPETAAASLIVTATSSNMTLIPDANLTLGGAGAARTIDALPAMDENGGPATITVTVDDGTNTTDEMFDVTVVAVNDPPSFTKGADQQNAAGMATVLGWATAISAGPPDEAGQTLVFNVTGNTNAAIFSAGPAVNATTGDLTYTTTAPGTATITLELMDNGGGTDTSPPQMFVIDIIPPPVAVDDPGFTTAFDTMLNTDPTNVLTNDTLNGATIDAGTKESTACTAAMGCSNNIVLDADGTFTYTPPTGFTGPDTFMYTLTNAAGMSSATVTIAVGDPPAAMNDTLTGGALGNVERDSTGVLNVLTNDGGDALTITGFDATSTVCAAIAGCANNVSVAGGGTFTYDPPPGYDGSDTFTYTIGNGFPSTSMGTVTITVAGMVWFVDEDATTAGDGRLNSPFTTLAAFETANGGATMAGGDVVDPEAGDCVFLYHSTTDYSGGVTLENNQILLGEGASAATDVQTVCGVTVPSGSDPLPALLGSTMRPTIVDAAGDAVTLASGNTIRGLNIGNTPNASSALADNGGSVGTLTVSDAAISGTGGLLDIQNGGTLAVTFDSLSSTGSTAGIDLDGVGGSLSVTNSGGADTTITGATNGIDITNSGAGASFTFSDTTVGSSGTGVNLASSGAATFTFNDLSITSTGGAGLIASSAGTLNTTGGTINTMTGTGVDITSTNTTTGITFDSVTVTVGTSDGIDIATSTGTKTFNALSLTTTDGVGLRANGAGTVNVNGGTNTITSTNRAAVDINNTATGITLQTVTSTDSTGRGISLSNIAAGSTLSVTGTTTVSNSADLGSLDGGINIDTVGAGSTINFGTTNINNRNDTGIFVNDMDGTSLTFGTTTIANPNAAEGYGIRVEDSSAAVTFAVANISDTNQTVATTDAGSDGVPDNEGDGDAIFLTNNTGSFTLNGGTIEDLATDGIDIRNSSNLTVSGVTIDDIGLSSGNVNPTNDNGIFALNLSGTNLVRNGTISRFRGGGVGGQDDSGIKILNIGVSFTEIRVDNVIFDNDLDGGLLGNRGFELTNRGAVSGNVVIENSIFRQLRGDGLGIGHGNTGGSGTLDLVVRNTSFIDSDTVAGAFGGIQGGVLGTALKNANFHGVTLDNLYPNNANNGMLGITTQEDGNFVLVVDDSDISDTDGRTGIYLTAGNSGTATDDPDTFDVKIHDTDFSNTDDEGVLMDVRGTALTGGGQIGEVRLVNNRIGDGGANLPVGNDGFEQGVFPRFRNDAKTIHILFDGNLIRNFSNSAGDEALDFDAEDNVTVNTTVTDNFFSATTIDPTHQVIIDAEDAGVTVNLDYRNNTKSEAAGSGNGSALLDNSAGATYNTNVSGNTPAPSTSGSFGSIGSATLPSGKVVPSPGSVSQSTIVSTAFAPLEVTLIENDGMPGAAITVTFSAPGAGASGTFPSGNTCVTNGSGICSVPFTANATAGAYEVNASATVSGSPESAKFLLLNRN